MKTLENIWHMKKKNDSFDGDAAILLLEKKSLLRYSYKDREEKNTNGFGFDVKNLPKNVILESF